MKTPKLITAPLFGRILKQFKLSLIGPHGPKHWAEVERRGLILAGHYGIDSKMITYFAWLHDSGRRSEGRDPQHGQRAALFIAGLHREGLIQLDSFELSNLIYAVGRHSDGLITDHLPIGICWDADRLDLGRPGVGIRPEVKRLSTGVAREYCLNQPGNGS